MSTRGSAYFEIVESGKNVKVGEIGLSRDAYPSGFGGEICKSLSNVYVGKPSQEQSVGKTFKNIERVILYLLDRPSDYFMEDEYVYRFIFSEPDNITDSFLVEDYVKVEVKHKYGDDNFSGSFKEFREYSKWE
jgi:hypothetical protein